MGEDGFGQCLTVQQAFLLKHPDKEKQNNMRVNVLSFMMQQISPPMPCVSVVLFCFVVKVFYHSRHNSEVQNHASKHRRCNVVPILNTLVVQKYNNNKKKQKKELHSAGELLLNSLGISQPGTFYNHRYRECYQTGW